MKASAGLGLGPATLAAGAAVVAVVGVAGYLVLAPSPDPSPDPVDTSATAPAETATAPAETPEATPAPTNAPSPAVAPPDVPEADVAQTPSFDLVRVDAAGGALIAGQATPDANLILRLDGEEISQVSADGTGAFVAMFTIPPAAVPRVLSLEMVMEDGSVLVSEESVILSPTLRVAADDGAGDTAPTGTGPATGPETPQAPAITELAADEAAPTSAPPQLMPPDDSAPDVPATVTTEPQGEVVVAEDATQDAPDLQVALADTGSEATESAVSRGLTASDAGGDIMPPASETVADTVEEGSTAPVTDGMPPEQPDELATAPALPPETGTAQGTSEPPVVAADDSPTAPPTDAVEMADAADQAEAPEVPATTGPEAPADTTAPSEIPNAGATQPETLTAAPQAPFAPGTAPQSPDTPAPVGTAPPDAEPLEPQAPTVLIADSDGLRMVQSGPAPQVQAQVTLDTISYDTQGEVVLTGRGPAESDVRFYLDNRPVQLARIDLTGAWRIALPQVDPGTYTLRLDEVNAEGDVQSRIETPFLREEPELLESLPAQADGQEVVTVQLGNTLWGIAREHLGEGIMYVQVYEANRSLIRDPDLIYPGQIFTIPELDE